MSWVSSRENRSSLSCLLGGTENDSNGLTGGVHAEVYNLLRSIPHPEEAAVDGFAG